jgi:hypothetical protein
MGGRENGFNGSVGVRLLVLRLRLVGPSSALQPICGVREVTGVFARAYSAVAHRPAQEVVVGRAASDDDLVVLSKGVVLGDSQWIILPPTFEAIQAARPVMMSVVPVVGHTALFRSSAYFIV